MLRRYRFAVALTVLTSLVVETLVLGPAHHHSVADSAPCSTHGVAACGDAAQGYATGELAGHAAVHRHCSSHDAVERAHSACQGCGVATVLREGRSPNANAGGHADSCAVCRFLAQLVAPGLDRTACSTASVVRRDSELPTLVIGTAPHSLPQPRSPPQGI